MGALARHIWLLLTLRHDARGLPGTWQPVLALIVLSSIFAALRWAVLYEQVLFAYAIELFSVGLALFVWLLLMSWISMRFAAAWALVSIGADCISMVLGPLDLLSDGVRAVLLLVETVALVRIATVLLRRQQRRQS